MGGWGGGHALQVAGWLGVKPVPAPLHTWQNPGPQPRHLLLPLYPPCRYVYLIGRSMFETELLPEHLAQHAREFDEIWVPSEFNRDSFVRSGIDPDKVEGGGHLS